jgi:hypothetical protein
MSSDCIVDACDMTVLGTPNISEVQGDIIASSSLHTQVGFMSGV